MLRSAPRIFQDLLPVDEDVNLSESCMSNPPQSRIKRVLLTLCDSLSTTFNVFGLCQQYPRRPSFEPNKFIPSSLLARSSPMTIHAHNTQRPHPPPKPPYPFLNMTTYSLMQWMNSGSHHKSESEVLRLIKEVIQAEDFNLVDLDGFLVRRSLYALDNDGGKGTTKFPNNWLETDVILDIPTKSADDPLTLDY
jgi:hypothetical protein